MTRHPSAPQVEAPKGQSATGAIKAYQPRVFRFEGVDHQQAVALKFYSVRRRAQAALSPSVLAAAKAYCKAALPSALSRVQPSDHAHHGAGYAIVHAGEMATWLLLHWWAFGDIAMGLIASAPKGERNFVSQGHTPIHACVWEQVVIAHERSAWVRHAMVERCDIDAYLADVLPDGEY